MSFTSTPLGQGRRLDHNAFLGKPQSPRLNSHTSYSYGAPALGSRSPPKPPHPDDQNDPALARSKLKRHNSNSQSLDPEKWSVKDTSVNIATAFHQAATDMNPNSSWASGSTRAVPIPRSTSVEYESQSQSTSARRLAAPPSRLQSRPTSSSRAKPLSKTPSVRHVPDSEGEEDAAPDQNGRGKSPFEQVIGAAKRAIINVPAAATYYVRQRSREPDEPVAVNGSYDYSAEERDIQNQSRHSAANHKRNRMSTDNKAYKPSTSDLDNSDEDFTDDDGKQKRRKKKKKESVGGPLTTLPVAGYDKRKKKPKRGSKGNAGEVEEGSDNDSQDKQSAPRGSAPPRRSAPPEQHDLNPDTSFEEAEQGLHSIPEVDDEDVVPIAKRPRSRSRSRGPPGARRSSSNPGAIIGIVLHTIFLVIGRVLGTSFDIILARPIRSVSRSFLASFLKYLFLFAILVSLVFVSRALPDLGLRLPWGGSGVFHAPAVPPGNMAEFAERLRRMEAALSGLSLDLERARSKVEEEARVNVELVGKMGALETRVTKESVRSHEAEAASRDATGQGLKSMKQDMEALQALVQAYQQQGGGGSGGSDEETRSKLKALEERIGPVEVGVREALELAKKGAGPGSSVGAAWWSKPGKSGMTIKSSDGQDVTAMIANLVNTAVGMYGKDNIGRVDFALHSSGAFVVPSLTSPSYELRPSTWRGTLVGYITGNGFGIGRSPVTALHHESHDGYCWPFAGSKGQLGVVLAAPAYIEDITIDHVAAEVALNMQRSAPRDMEVWAIVEGRDNLDKLQAWRAQRAERRENGESMEDEPVRPKSLPRSTEWLRIATFRYDIHSPDNIQTFPVDQEIKDLGIDFGVVVLMVKNNWGMDAFTCLYRFRVHGQMMGAPTDPYPEELSP
ncbi:hypothetical protein DFH07DRAFT_369223 [Mycena maculata]|uniref:SUN domain-containing protein n=1 Tax=Mycena maculata TaxID=230809 RepID=A0AAD7H938_9AGAR|nr:hypothetical protein DFH07DRAFT_369223 [Mycena maculata]